MSDYETGTESSTPPPEIGIFGRLTGVFFSPERTFAAIAAKPGWDWLVPVFLVMIVGIFVQTVAFKRVDVDEAVREQMRFVEKMAGGNIPAERREEIEEQTRERFEKEKDPVRRALFMPLAFIPFLFVPAVYRGIAGAMSVEASYKKLLAGYAWVQMPGILAAFLAGLVTLPRSEVDVTDVQFMRLLKSNVAAFLPWETTHKALLALLSSIDIFDIWAFVLGGIMVSKATAFSRRGAYWVVGGVWGAYILVKVILGFAYQAFMG